MPDNGELESDDDDMTGGEMMSISRTIVNERSRDDDDGMLDIFNIDEQISEIRDVKRDGFMSDVIHRPDDR